MKLSLSYRLRTLMAERGLSQADIVRLCESRGRERGIVIRQQDVSKYVNGTALPTEDRVELLADSLSVPAIWLLGYETTDAFTEEEVSLCNAWRLCSDKEKETIAFILRDYGFIFEPRITTSSAFA